MTKRILYILWRYTFGAVLDRLPLFIATLVLLDPLKFDPNSILTYFVKYAFLFEVESECITYKSYFRNDFYYALLVAWIAVIIVCIIDASCRRLNDKNRTRIVTTICTVWYTVLVTVFLVRRFLIWTFGMQITTESLSLLLETNGEESWGFINSFLLNWQGAKWMIKFILAAIIIGTAEWFWNKKRTVIMRNRIAKIAVTLIISLLLPVGVISIGDYQYVGWLSGQNTLSATVVAVRDYNKQKKLSENFFNTVINIDKKRDVASCNDDSLNVIFVIGESLIHHHASIYGYYLPTTPLLQQEVDSGNLVVFDDVISPFNSTTGSVTNMLSLNSLAIGEKWYDHPFFPQLFHKAGYKVMVFDNQHGMDKAFSGSFYQMYSPVVTSRCYDYIADDVWNFDKELVAAMRPFAIKENSNTFYLLHFMGQHVGYGERTPNSDRKFTASDVKRSEPWMTDEMRELIALYDNAVLLTDKSLGILFDMFRNSKAVLVFVSDHGEEVYDYRPMFGRRPMDSQMKQQYANNIYRVPCVVWMSDKYKSAYPKVVQEIQKSKSRPYSHDRIGHMTLNLGRIITPYYRSSDDVASDDFHPRKRVVGDLDFDSLMQTSTNK